jgi:CBS domain containing-hemolysin-like protein
MVYSPDQANVRAAWLLSHGFASVVAIAVLILPYDRRDGAKSLALSHAERMAIWITPVMLWIKTLVFPLIVALTARERGLALLGVNRQAQNAGNARRRSCDDRPGE